MKKILLVVAILWLTAISVFADPFLTCDPQAGVTRYKFVLEGGTGEFSGASLDGSANHDVGPWSVGITKGDYYAGKPYMLDGVDQGVYVWSTPVPFVLEKPSVALPTGTGLIE